MRTTAIILTCLVLAGCQASDERREAQDDAYCRKTVSDRNDSRPSAYQECRDNMMGYHRNAAIAASGR